MVRSRVWDASTFVGNTVDVVVESCKVGLRKPDPRIYELTCRALNVAPSRVIYLDDIGVSLSVNCLLCTLHPTAS